VLSWFMRANKKEQPVLPWSLTQSSRHFVLRSMFRPNSKHLRYHAPPQVAKEGARRPSAEQEEGAPRRSIHQFVTMQIKKMMYTTLFILCDPVHASHSASWFSRSSCAEIQIEESVALRQTQPKRNPARGVNRGCPEGCIA
jgi:hypothetical protein